MSDTDSFAFVLDSPASGAPQKAQRPPLHGANRGATSAGSSPQLPPSMGKRRVKPTSKRADELSDTESIAFAMEGEELPAPRRAAADSLPSSSPAPGALRRSGSMLSSSSFQFQLVDDAAGHSLLGPAHRSASRPRSADGLDNESFAFVLEDAPGTNGAPLPRRASQGGTSAAPPPLRRDDDTIQLEEMSETNSPAFTEETPLPPRGRHLPGPRAPRSVADDDEASSVLFQLEPEEDSQPHLISPPGGAPDNSSIAFAVLPANEDGVPEPGRAAASHTGLGASLSGEKKTVISVRLGRSGSQASTPRRVLRPVKARQPPEKQGEEEANEIQFEEAHGAAAGGVRPLARGRLVPLTSKTSPRRPLKAEPEPEPEPEPGDQEDHGDGHQLVERHLQEQETENEFFRRGFERVASTKLRLDPFPGERGLRSPKKSAEEKEEEDSLPPPPPIQREKTCKPLSETTNTAPIAKAMPRETTAAAEDKTQRQPSRAVRTKIVRPASPAGRGPTKVALPHRPARGSESPHKSKTKWGSKERPDPAELEAAARLTEDWRLFNEQQRRDIERLKRSIAAARRPEEWAVQSRAHHHQSAAPAGKGMELGATTNRAPVSPAAVARRLLHPAASPSRAVPPPLPATTAPTYAVPRQTELPNGHRRSSTQHTTYYLARRPADDPNSPGPTRFSAEISTGRRPATPQRKTPAGVRRGTARPGAPEAASRAESSFPSPSPPSPRRPPAGSPSAQERVAALLGVLWPPARTEGGDRLMHFVSGTRLTSEQVQRFDAAVAAQSSANELHRQQIINSFFEAMPRRPPPVSKKLPQHLSRSRVIREVFDVMDLRRTGVLSADCMAAVKVVLEKDLQAMDDELRVGGRCFGLPVMLFHPTAAVAAEALGRPPPHVGSAHHQSSSLRTTLLSPPSAGWKAYLDGWRQLTQHVERFRNSFQKTVDLGGSPQIAADAAAAGWKALLPALHCQFLQLRRRALLLSLAVNVVLPLCMSCGLGDMDFAAVSLVVLMALDGKRSLLALCAEGELFRQILSSYFDVLCGEHKVGTEAFG